MMKTSTVSIVAKNKKHCLLYDLWSQATAHTRILPQSVCCHDNNNSSWKVIDANLAICSTCGFFHVCKDSSTCPLIINDDGYPVCTITACQVNCLVQSQLEYIDTVGPLESAPSNQQQQQQQRGKQSLGSIPRDSLSSIVRTHCQDLLYGDKWDHCTKTEIEKSSSRKRISLYKYLKDFKIKNQGKMPNMALAACAMLNQSRGTRNLPVVSKAERKKLVDWCVGSITKHLLLLESVSPGVIQVSRLGGICTGLIYQMRSGVIMHGLVLLPRCEDLVGLLPMESYLEPVFGIKSKCITETENLIKEVLRDVQWKGPSLCIVSGIEQRIRE